MQEETQSLCRTGHSAACTAAVCMCVCVCVYVWLCLWLCVLGEARPASRRKSMTATPPCAATGTAIVRVSTADRLVKENGNTHTQTRNNGRGRKGRQETDSNGGGGRQETDRQTDRHRQTDRWWRGRGDHAHLPEGGTPSWGIPYNSSSGGSRGKKEEGEGWGQR
eukprot:482014-Rhodomonas_salina.3